MSVRWPRSMFDVYQALLGTKEIEPTGFYGLFCDCPEPAHYIDEESAVTEETISAIRETIRMYPRGTHAIISTHPESKGVGAWMLTDKTLLSLCEMASKYLDLCD